MCACNGQERRVLVLHARDKAYFVLFIGFSPLRVKSQDKLYKRRDRHGGEPRRAPELIRCGIRGMGGYENLIGAVPILFYMLTTQGAYQRLLSRLSRLPNGRQRSKLLDFASVFNQFCK